MAISKEKKQSLVSEISQLLRSAKGTAVATYQGSTVQELQQLRKSAREAGVVIKVTKNRLFKVALSSVDTYKDADSSALVGQLIYAISAEDEVAPAKVLDQFAKSHPSVQLIAGYSDQGVTLSQSDVQSLASLPSKQQLIAEVVATLMSPIHDVTNALSGNLHALLDGLQAKAN